MVAGALWRLCHLEHTTEAIAVLERVAANA